MDEGGFYVYRWSVADLSLTSALCLAEISAKHALYYHPQRGQKTPHSGRKAIAAVSFCQSI
jgi:hypothetical protein